MQRRKTLSRGINRSEVATAPCRCTNEDRSETHKETAMFEGTIQEQVIARAMKDPAFRQALLSNPRAVLAREYHVYLAEEISLRVLEEPPHTFTLVLPGRKRCWNSLMPISTLSAGARQ
jgi:hypothetical protein